MCFFNLLGGAFEGKPEDLSGRISGAASDLILRAFEGIDPSKLLDCHTHIAGIGAGGTNASIHPRMQSWKHPFHRTKLQVYLNAACVEHKENADEEFLLRLIDLVKHFPNHGKHQILAFDKHYNPDGSVNASKTEFYVPNEYVFQIASQNPDLFVPAISVNPYRSDAVVELERWAQRGARIVKWLPNAMGINPDDGRCDRFYEAMKRLHFILLSHGGEEKAVHAKEDQKLGSPLLLRRPLEHGIKVIVAHCAGLGENEDLESSGRAQRSNFDLFLRLMQEKKYDGLLFGDISALTQYNRIGAPLTTLLEREDLHERLINGSDYPLPAINFLIRTAPMIKTGYLKKEEATLLKEIYRFNPLLFDFVLKRRIAAPRSGKRFPANVFHAHPALSA